MPDTPKPLLECLDMVTRPTAPAPQALGGGARGRAQALHVRRVRSIFEDKNIIAVGISEKVTEKKATGELSLCFYVEKKIPKSKIGAGKLLPPVMAAADGQAVFTDVKLIGRVRPEVQKKRAPIQSGFSVAHVNVGAGTVGAIVKKGTKFFILSNSHVLADSGLANVKDDILYPGSLDKGALPKNLVGTLSRFITFKVGGEFLNRVDAALCSISADRLADLDFAIHGVTGAPKTTVATRGMKVVKVGRTTGKTEGKVLDVNFRVVIPYDGVGDVGFHDQVLCTRYTKPGDSGAIVVDKASGKIVGLHFAGASGGSVFNPIANVLSALKCTFASA